VLDYGRHFLQAQSLTVTATRETFLREIAPARTYVLRPEVDAFMKQGLGKGATEENTLVLEEDGTLSGKPRFPDECVRHKLLDLIGDLFFVGTPVSARVVGYKSGHTTNIQLAAAMKNALKA
jgi:UDP-3-O-acyl-N-acetylglucosamine deacetylase